MANLQELGEQYAKKLIAAVNKQLTGREIAEEIERLTYSDTKQPLSDYDKKYLIDNISSFIKNHYIIKEADNEKYLELVNYIQSNLKGGK